MSKDYKLGILFGLLVLGAGVIYWVALDKPDAESSEQPKQAYRVQLVGESDEDDESAAVETVTTEEITAPIPDETTTVPDEIGPVAPVALVAPVGSAVAAPDSDDVTVSGGFQLDANADSVVNADDPIIDPTPIPVPEYVDIKDRADRSTYTVRGGDNGFSVVSIRVYNTPKHWKLIRDANPGILSTALRPGMVLKIPPPPSHDIAPEPVSPTHGKTLTNLTGQKVYVVSGNDTSGLWGISRKVYGQNMGHLYPLIQAANPKVDSTKLKPGMKLIIPPAQSVKLTIPVTNKPGKGVQPGQIVTIDSKRYYIVRAGDAGFGYIAQKVYGSTRYAYLISEANPNAHTATLMPRDKLLLPPKPAGEIPGRPAEPRTKRSERGNPRRPYFGN